MIIMYCYLLSFRTPEYVHLCLCYITMDIESIVSTMEACIVYCAKSKWYITRDLLYFIYVYTYGHFKRWWILRTLYLLSFITYLFTSIFSLLSLKGLKCTFAFYDFYHVPLHEMCCMYHHIVLCIKYYTRFVRNNEIKMSNLTQCFKLQGAVSIRKTVLPGVAIPMLKIRHPNGRLIFNIGIAIPR